jgi:hypothetical protein
MASYELSRQDMIEPIERMYEREYGAEFGMFETLEEENADGDEGNVDLVYVHGDSENLHVIRIENSYDDCLFDINRGIHSMSDVQANSRWIALPLYELRDGEDKWNDRMKSECEQRGIGIITAQKKGRGVSAKVIMEPERQEGEFLQAYGDLQKKWHEYTRTEEMPEGFKAVDYYNR